MWCDARTFGSGLTALALAGASLFACQFEPGANGNAGDDDGVGVADAAPIGDGQQPGDDGGPDAGSVDCVPNQRSCSGRDLRTCNAAGDGYSSQATCPFTCDVDHCTVASNIEQGAQEACVAADAARLSPPTGATVSLTSDGDGRITCSPSCNDAGGTAIDAAGVVEQGNVDLAYFCLSELNIPTGVVFSAQAGIPRSIAFFVAGHVAVGGTIAFDGSDADGVATAAAAGPGGGRGGARSGGNGQPGQGPCPGQGGERLVQMAPDQIVGGGGGGAGYGSIGGRGGTGRLSPGVDAAAGDAGAICAGATLEPLVGGSGGGGGGDGACGGDCGWPGGGGGGAIQISAVEGINLSGAIRARGGNGFGDPGSPAGGAGGGGSGGAILLEGPSVTIGGVRLDVSGGGGGDAGGGSGGAGATADLSAGQGASGNQDLEGGAGGGGGGGRVRINASNTPSCDGVTSPSSVCTAGALQTGGSIGSQE